MKKNLKNVLRVFIVLILPLLTGCGAKEYFKNAVLGNMPFVKSFTQQNFKTKTNILSMKDEMKLVTAKQQIDFINIMDGKDGRYLEVSTYEVKAGIDCSKIRKIVQDDSTTYEYPPLEIFSSNKIYSVVPRTEADKLDQHFFENAIKPVNIAYAQKAKDYAVELGLLENAEEGARRTFKNLMNAQTQLEVQDYKRQYEVQYLPFTLDVYKNYFDENKMEVTQFEKDKFYRDGFEVHCVGNDNWSIRIGDTGRTFDGSFDEFYQNVFETNSNENNKDQDRVEIYRYFDPMYPKECEVLGYASDRFRTMFLLNNGRIYYVDAVVGNEQTLLNDISPTMVYLAASLRTVKDRKIDYADEYQQYVNNFFAVQENLRSNATRISLKNSTDRLVDSNVIKGTETEDSIEEKYFKAVSDVKCLGRTNEQNSVQQTGDVEFDSLTSLIKDLLVSPDNFSTDETREKGLEIATALDSRIYHKKNKKAANSQYLETWFLQNNKRFDLSAATRKRYEDDIKSGETYIASRPMIAVLNDSERNEYYYSLFKNRLASSHFFVDTADVIENSMKRSVRDSNMFVYYNLPDLEETSDGEIYERIVKKNDGHEIKNSFIFIFNQRTWDWGNFGEDNDIHALILDDSTVRFFLNVGALNFAESSYEKSTDAVSSGLNSLGLWKVGNSNSKSPIDILLNSNKVPAYFYFGDWKKLRITPETVTINGYSFTTNKFTKKSKEAYRNTNDYAEKSVIARVLDDLQHAYSNDDADYYFNVLCDNLDDQIQRYVYEKIFRPSPRMILDMREDPKHRYNM